MERRDYLEFNGGDCLKSELEVEERLAARELADRLRAARRLVGEEGRYESVAGYDPVLRSHCRLEKE